MGFFAFMICAHVRSALASRGSIAGREAKPFLGQGVRFGLAVAVLAASPPI
jgi:hypothetical protein